MNSEYLEWIKIGVSILTPLVLAGVGLKISRSLEHAKVGIAKDKEWNAEWAKRFYAEVVLFNDAIAEMINVLFTLTQEAKDKKPGWEERNKKLGGNAADIMFRARKAEWSLRIMCAFCPSAKDEVLSCTSTIFSQVSSIRQNGVGSFDDIQNSLESFNVVAKKAHREIFG